VSELPLELEAALAATAAALDAGDDPAAVAAARRAATACAELERQGWRLEPGLLGRARALQDRCAAVAGHRMAGLVRELGTAARSRRAADAYGR